MTTRGPSSADYPGSGTPGGEGGLEPTESLELISEDAAALAHGTHDSQATSVESPRGKTAVPLAPRTPQPVARRRDDGPDQRIGDVLGSYRLIELLGKGGMGYVYRAEHVRLGREVALKLLRGDYASRRDAVSRFFQEARTVNRIRHRNIVDVTDFVELDDGTTFIIMELLTGTSLGSWAKQARDRAAPIDPAGAARPTDGAATSIDLPRALAVLIQVCDGLDAAHQVGVVHRDLKPDNVIVVPTGDGADLVKLLDFGVAKLLNRDDEDIGFETAAGSVIGTPAYMSPEQAGGMLVDGRSDIYSLGALMYEMFCGQPMFRGRAFGEFVRKHLTEAPALPRLTPGGAGIDPALEAVILRCLEKEPAKRYPSVLALREALLGLLGGPLPYPLVPGLGTTGPHRHTPVPPAGGPPVHAATQRTSSAPAWRWRLGGAAALGLIAAAVVVAARERPQVAPPAHPVPRSSAAVAPSAEPIAPAPAPSPAVIELRFASQPSGALFADGGAVELCRTPCSVQIERSTPVEASGGGAASAGGAASRPVDAGAGGAASVGGAGSHPSDAGARRAFVVRRAGYRDAVITVDLAAAQRDFEVALQPVDRARDRAGSEPMRQVKRPSRPARGSRAAPAMVATPVDQARPAPASALPSAPANSLPNSPPPPAPKPPPIDPSDTIDPFARTP